MVSTRTSLGLLEPTADQVCVYCGAKFWIKECTQQGEYNICCNKGGIYIPPPPQPSEYIRNILFNHESFDSKIFYPKARVLNSNCAFASVNMQIDHTIIPGHGPPTIRIHLILSKKNKMKQQLRNAKVCIWSFSIEFGTFALWKTNLIRLKVEYIGRWQAVRWEKPV